MLEKTALYAESWNVAFRERTIGTILLNKEDTFTLINNSVRYWAADPFVFEYDGHVYIFAELYDYIRCRGVLGYCEIKDGVPTPWEIIIKEPYHLSYPCIFEYNEKIYIMPESGEGKELSIYEAVDFPSTWEKCKVIRRDAKYTDTTPIPLEGMKLALTHCQNNFKKTQLTLIDLDNRCMDKFVSNTNALRSRPAGHLFVMDGQLIRPAQVSESGSDGYGKGLIFYQCQLDDELEYSETEIKEIYPKDLKYNRSIFLDGMHTYNGSEHYEVIDIKTRRFNLLNLFMRLVGKVMKR